MLGKRGGRKRTYALFVILVTIGGVLAAGFAYFNFFQGCGTPPAPRSYGGVYATTFNGITFLAINYTFTSTGQSVVIGNVTFQSVQFFDPSFPHLVSGQCITDTTSPATLIMNARFFPAGLVYQLGIQYGVTRTYQEEFTECSGSQAAVLWYPDNPYVVLMARSC